jgi:hypothetical protein
MRSQSVENSALKLCNDFGRTDLWKETFDRSLTFNQIISYFVLGWNKILGVYFLASKLSETFKEI